MKKNVFVIETTGLIGHNFVFVFHLVMQKPMCFLLKLQFILWV